MSEERRQPMRRRGPMGGPGMMPGEKAKDFKGSVGKLLNYMGKPSAEQPLISSDRRF